MGQISTQVQHIVASECDKELLSSGWLSDVKVECGTKSWTLHRNILMTRSPYFKTAASELPEDCIEKLEEYSPVLITCIDLFTLAKFFAMDGLRKRAIDVLTERFVHEATRLQTRVRDEAAVEDIQGDVDRFAPYLLEALKTVYKADNSDLHPLKPTFLLYLKLTRYVVLRDDLLGATLLREQPEYADFLADILKATLFRPFEEGKEDRDLPYQALREDGVAMMMKIAADRLLTNTKVIATGL
ncbi:hypothetical protein F5Y09DRAFT_348590 [Xylaria sp. FL1042]|nr:hypothetical protein F5Y09DRAFT_348590 [Xylaria sp. FL1042]